MNNTKQISKNALFLYLRTGVSIIIQLIAVRYLLKYLGEDGYGLYGLIGSIVAILSSMRGLLSSSVQRFFNIAIGRKQDDVICDIFNASLIIHVIIGLILAIGTLVMGLVLMPHLSIPTSYQSQAIWVLIFSALTMAVDVVSVPYSALLIAFERFNIYAFLSIIESVLKLGIVLILIIFPTGRVAIYAALLCGVAFIMRLAYVTAVKHKFRNLVKICKLKNTKLLKELSVFAGYKGIGTVANAIQNSGINFILNIFGGLIVNTARTISHQVLSAVNVLVWNINAAFVPRIITLYGENKIQEYTNLVISMTKFTFFINIVTGFSISILIHPILNFWLGTIPPYTSGFIVLVFYYAIGRSLIDGIDAVFSAEGKVKEFQFLILGCMIVTLAGSWLMLKLGYSFYIAFSIMGITELTTSIGCYMLASKITSFNVKRIAREVLIPAGVLIIVYTIVGLVLGSIIPSSLNIFSLIMLFVTSMTSCGFCTVICLLNKKERHSLLKFIIRKYRNTFEKKESF